jgi:hypothetical protein
MYYRETLAYLSNKLTSAGNLFLANELRARCFELHEYILKKEKRSVFDRERVVYYFNKWLAGYGANIWLPIGWMVEFNLLFVLLMLGTNKRYHWSFIVGVILIYLFGKWLLVKNDRICRYFYYFVVCMGILISGAFINNVDVYYIKYFFSNFVPPLPDIVIGGHFDDAYTDMRKSWNPSMLWGFPKLVSSFMWYLIYKCVRFRNGG